MTHTWKKNVRGLRAGISLFALISCAALPALAESADSEMYTEAQAGLANAYSDYYRELRKRPGFTPEQAKEVADRILSPANAKVAHALEEDFKRTYKSGAEQSLTDAKRTDAKRQPASVQDRKKSGDSGAPQEAVIQEEIVIDGTSIPAEIEFPGKPKTPAAVPAPQTVQKPAVQKK